MVALGSAKDGGVYIFYSPNIPACYYEIFCPFEELRKYFSEAQLVELGTWVAFCVGFGRLDAVWDMIEELPAEFQLQSDRPIAPWCGEPVIVR